VLTHLWGIGLRPGHFPEYAELSVVPPVEIMTDNLLHHRGGPALYHTQRIVSRAPQVFLHGIGLNIGGWDPLCSQYVSGLKELIDTFKPSVVSDHLCFTQAAGLQSYELLPLTRNQSTLEHVIRKTDDLQQRIGRQFCLENVSAYVSFAEDHFTEGDFLNEISRRTGCGILLDVNNVFVSARNFNLDPLAELNRYNLAAVQQIHIAGHSEREDFLFDTHDAPVCSDVWSMLAHVLKSRPDIPVILENDHNETTLRTLLDELKWGIQRCNHE